MAEVDPTVCCPSKGEHQTGLSYALQLATIVSALVTMILAIIAFASAGDVNKTLDGIYSSWNTMPILDVSAVLQSSFDNAEAACTSLGKDWYPIDTFPTWPGTQKGCDCSSMNKTSSNTTTTTSSCKSSYTNDCSKTCKEDHDCSDVSGEDPIDIEIFNGHYLCVKRGGQSALNRTADLYDLKDVGKCTSDDTVCGPLADFFLNGSTSFPPDITPGPSENFCFPKNASGCPLVHFETTLTPTPNCTTALNSSNANGCTAVTGFGLFLTWTASAIDIFKPENYTFDWRAIPNVELSAGDICFSNSNTAIDRTGNKNTIQSKNGTGCPKIDDTNKYLKPEKKCLSGENFNGCPSDNNSEMNTALGLSSGYSTKFDTRFYPAGKFNLTQAWAENGVDAHFVADSNKKLNFQARPEIFWTEKCPESRLNVYNKQADSQALSGLQLTLMLVNILVLIIFWCIFPRLRKKDIEKASEDASGKHHTAFIVKWAAKGGKYIIAMVVVGICATLINYFAKVSEGKCSDDLTNANFWQIWDTLKSVGGLDEATATIDGITGAGDILELCVQRLRSATDSVVED